MVYMLSIFAEKRKTVMAQWLLNNCNCVAISGTGLIINKLLWYLKTGTLGYRGHKISESEGILCKKRV
jgi:hypothetical protein